MSSSLYSPRWGWVILFPGFCFPPKKVSCVFSQFEDPVCEFSRLNTPACRAFLCSWLGTCMSWAVSEQFVKPVSGTELQSDICGKASCILSLFCFGFGFLPSCNRFFLIFGINAPRHKRGSDHRQVLLCLFIISTSSSSTFTLCVAEYFNFFFYLAFLRLHFLPSSDFCHLCHPAWAAGTAAASAELSKWPQPGVRGSRVFALCLASCPGRFVTPSASTLKEELCILLRLKQPSVSSKIGKVKKGKKKRCIHPV